MNICFRVDASSEMGTGHVMRCLGLAQVLRQRGDRVIFICRALPGNLLDLIATYGYETVALPLPDPTVESVPDELTHASWLGVHWTRDAEETTDAIAAVSGTVDWLVVDHYALDARWEGRLRGHCSHILAIDDLADRQHDCDMLLDQNLHSDAEARYASRVADGCRLLCGPRYVLLRGEFAVARSRMRLRSGSVSRVMVFFGGVDRDNFTAQLIDQLADWLPPNLQVDIVVGASNTHLGMLRRMCVHRPQFVLRERVEDMAALLNETDLAIGAAGGSVWERCCLGVPSIVVSVARNQDPGLRRLGEMGAAFVVEPQARNPETSAVAIADALRFALVSPLALRRQSKLAGELVDGQGAVRVMRRMLKTDLNVRRANSGDCDNILAWRNHPVIRASSRSSIEITPKQHEAWLKGVIANPSVELLICLSGEQAVGVLRYDISNEVAEVSIYLVPESLGSGLGGHVLAAGETWLRAERPAVKRIWADVLAGNHGSMQMFRNAGFQDISNRFERHLT